MNLFAQGASLLLFSNHESIHSQIEFDLYSGPRRANHSQKQCFKAHCRSSYSPMSYSNECYEAFFLHTLKQFQMAKATQSNFQFRFQLKFGDAYFTNLPRALREESTISLFKLKSALEKGQRNTYFDVNRGYDDVNNDVDEETESSPDNDNFEVNHIKI